MKSTLIKTSCSGCSELVTLDLTRDIAVMTVPANGVRGRGHVPLHTVSADLSGDEDMLTWDCPRCEHADSFDLND